MTGVRLLAHQFHCDLRRFWRNPQSRYFTVLLPIVFLVLFAAIFKGFTVVGGKPLAITTYYVPSIMTLGIISATFVNISVAVVNMRERGELKRMRGTPLPASFVICSRAAVGVVVAVVMSGLLLALGAIAYGVSVPGSTIVGLILAVIVGAASFACIAFAFSTLVGSEEAAPPATNLAVLPLYFISGVFIPEAQIPKFLRDIAAVFPVRHLAHAMLTPFANPHGMGVSAVDLLIVAAWGIAALALAARRFKWSPLAPG
jgi:ABC-2 type transport system permease protein